MKKFIFALFGLLSVPSFAAIGGGPPGGIYISQVENAGSTVTQRGTLNFKGSGVSVADNNVSSRTDVTINSGGGASNLAVSQNGVVISSPTAVLNFVGTGASIALTGGATAQITVNAGDVFKASTQTFTGQNTFASAQPSTFTNLTANTLNLPNQVNHGVLYMNGPPISSTSTFTFNGSTLTVAQLSAMGVTVSTIQVNNQLLDYSGSPGPAGYIFTSNGSSLPPSWQATSSTSTGLIVIGSPQTNYEVVWNGSAAQWTPEGFSYLFTIASFSDGIGSPLEIGNGVWLSTGNITFNASYNNGPATGGYVSFSGWSNLNLTSSFQGPTSTLANTNFPSVGGSVVFTLNATNGSSSPTASITHTFNNERYWGNSRISTGSYTSADIRGLTGGGNDLTNSIPTNFEVTAGAGQYIVYSYPSRLGTASFSVGGFAGGFNAPVTTSVTNASGFIENYSVYSSVNANLGSTTVTVTTP